MARLELLLKMLENEPNDPFLKYGIAMEHLGAGSTSEAVDWLHRTKRENPEYAPTYYQLGKLLYQSGELSTAIEILEEGIHHAHAANDQLTLREMKSLLEEVREDLG